MSGFSELILPDVHITFSWARRAKNRVNSFDGFRPYRDGVAELQALSWDEIHGILERAVQRGLARRGAEPIAHPGVG